MYEIPQTPEFSEWLDGLDPTATNRILGVLDRMAQGNWGDYKPVAGAPGIFERRLMGRGPGIRLYFCRQGGNPMLFLTGGDKASQQRSDIAQARRPRERYA